jgi:hypothetical protein
MGGRCAGSEGSYDAIILSERFDVSSSNCPEIVFLFFCMSYCVRPHSIRLGFCGNTVA